MKSTFSYENGQEYLVKEGDTLSEVLYERTSKRLYGKQGLLVKVLEKNQETIQEVDKIYPGQILILPAFKPVQDSSADFQENIEVFDKNEWGATLGYQARAIQSLEFSSSSRSELVSDLGIHSQLYSNQFWSEYWQTQVFIKLLWLKFKTPQGRNLSNSNIFLTDFGFQMKKIFLQSQTDFSFRLHFPQKLYINNFTSTSSSLELDQTFMAQSDLSIKQSLAHTEKYNAGVVSSIGYFYHLLSSSSSLYSGLPTKFGLYLENQLRNSKLLSELSFHYEKSKSSTLEYTDRYFEFLVGVEF